MDHTATIVATAKKLKLLDADGKLVALDSLTTLDLVTQLENTLGFPIPTTEIRPDAFRTIESVAALLSRLSTKKS